MFNPKLPLWDHVIFVDWNGVLSRDPFWMSIVKSKIHPLRERLNDELQRLFEDSEFIDMWMRGGLSSKEALEKLHVQLDKRFGNDFLQRRLLRDCQEMSVNEKLVNLLGEACAYAFVVIATDNMDCFYEQVLYARAKRHSRTFLQSSSRLKNTVHRFDEVLCSSALGILKREEPAVFFGKWLKSHKLTFDRALLLDDSESNCGAFKQAGGRAIRVLQSDFDDEFQHIRLLVSEWLNRPLAQKVRARRAQ